MTSAETTSEACDGDFSPKPVERLKVEFNFSGHAVARLTVSQARELFGLAETLGGENLTLTVAALAENRGYAYLDRLMSHVTGSHVYGLKDLMISDADSNEGLYPEL